MADLGSTKIYGELNVTGNTKISKNSYIDFGPNSTWNKILRIGGNGYTASGNMASVVTTDGNLHLDATSSHAIYLNHYSGNFVNFGNGNGVITAQMDSSGQLWYTQKSANLPYWHKGNDGAGSGLDADTVDGIQGTQLLRNDQNSMFVGQLTVDNANKISNGYSWTNSAIQTTSIEIIDANFNDDTVCPTLFMHNYGDGGVKFRMGNTGDKTLYLSSGASNNAGSPTDDNSGLFFDTLKINNNVVWHAGNDGTGSGLDADLLDGYHASITSSGNNIAVRDSSGDVHARLFRSEFDTTNSSIGYIMTQVNTIDNNYIRPSTPAQFRTAVTDSYYLGINANAKSSTFSTYSLATDLRDVRPNTSGLSSVKGVKAFFTSEGGLNGAVDANYLDMIVLDTWTDSSAGKVNGLTFDKSTMTIKHYQAPWNSATWGVGKTLAYTDSNITGNSGSATKLQTARTINGVAFDGTANITVADNTKLPLTGGTITGDLSVTGNLDFGKYEDFIYGNVVAKYNSGGNTTERIKITLPWKYADAKMLRFKIDVYSSYNTETYEVSGYLYPTTGNWYLSRVFYTGTSAGNSGSFRVGVEADGTAYVSFNANNYKGVVVRDLLIGYTGTDADYKNRNWTISVDATLPNALTPDLHKHLVTRANGNVLIGKDTDNGTGVLQLQGDLHTYGNLKAENTNPVVILRSTGTGAAQTGWISLRDNTDSEKGYFGFGSSGNEHLYINNNLANGDILLNTNTARNVRSNTNIIGTSTSTTWYNSGLQTEGDGNTITPSIGFHQPGQYAGSIIMASPTEFRFLNQGRTAYNDIVISGLHSYGNGRVYNNSYIDFGPNTGWGASLRIGGNGHSAGDSETIASVVTTNGNLHLDSGQTKAMYLNWYSGAGGIFFGTGDGTNRAAWMRADGQLEAASADDLYIKEYGTYQRVGNLKAATNDVNQWYASAPLELRELNYAGAQSGASTQAPYMTFHWAGRVQTRLGMLYNGKLHVSQSDAGWAQIALINHAQFWLYSTTTANYGLIEARRVGSIVTLTCIAPYNTGAAAYWHVFNSVIPSGYRPQAVCANSYMDQNNTSDAYGDGADHTIVCETNGTIRISHSGTTNYVGGFTITYNAATW